MFDRIRKARSPSAPEGNGPLMATPDMLARWATVNRMHYAAVPPDGGFRLSGEQDGRAWHVECGASTRSYLDGMELRGRADAGADADAAVMVLTRPLREALESQAYEAITDGVQTTVDNSLPEELRWLSMYEEMSWPGLPASFRHRFSVVADRLEDAQRWVHAPLVSMLLDGVEQSEGEGAPELPLLLMLVRGHVYLRRAYRTPTVAAVDHACALLRLAGLAAWHNLPPAPEPTGPDMLSGPDSAP